MKLCLVELLFQLLESHPTWVRGLKLVFEKGNTMPTMSHPTWVRGLKHDAMVEIVAIA